MHIFLNTKEPSLDLPVPVTSLDKVQGCVMKGLQRKKFLVKAVDIPKSELL